MLEPVFKNAGDNFVVCGVNKDHKLTALQKEGIEFGPLKQHQGLLINKKFVLICGLSLRMGGNTSHARPMLILPISPNDADSALSEEFLEKVR